MCTQFQDNPSSVVDSKPAREKCGSYRRKKESFEGVLPGVKGAVYII